MQQHKQNAYSPDGTQHAQPLAFGASAQCAVAPVSISGVPAGAPEVLRGQQPRGCCSIRLACIFCFFLPVAATLVALGFGLFLLQAQDQLEMAEAMDPDEDFVSLGGQCTITGVRHSTEDYKRKVVGHQALIGCYDYYVYEFVFGADGADVYESQRFRVDRGSYPTLCSVAGDWETEGPFNTAKDGGADAVACWRPAAGADVPDGYSCGNSQCYKIRDPREERASSIEGASKGMANGKLLVGLGAGLGVVGVFLALVVPCCRAPCIECVEDCR